MWSPAGEWLTYQGPRSWRRMSLALLTANNRNSSVIKDGVVCLTFLPGLGFALVCAFTTFVCAVKMAVRSDVQMSCCIHNIFLGSHPLCLALALSGAPLSAMTPKLWGCNTHVPVRTEHSALSYALHLGQLWVMVSIPIYGK